MDAEFVLEDNLENYIVLNEQSNNMLILEVNMHLVEDAKFEVNDKENNVESEQEITKKGKSKRKEKPK